MSDPHDDGLALPAGRARAFDWIDESPAVDVMGALLAAQPDCARFVGGCVRDGLVGVEAKDIDIATTLTPDQVRAALKAKSLGAAPTGIEHGTITATANHQGVEVTTLRADVSTDGRRASVEFTTDWRKDAARRDFTINALYLTPDRRLHDPVGGLADLDARRVRFIGDPVQRIREDYLRILRFFRFSARFADEFDDDGLQACASLKAGMDILSAERVGDEFSKLLSMSKPHAAVSAMAASGVLSEIWPAPADIERFGRLKILAPDAAPALGLAALWGARGDGIDARLRLSNADAARRKTAIKLAGDIHPDLTPHQVRALVYRNGERAWSDALALAEASYLSDAAAPYARDQRFQALAETAHSWTVPKSPFAGRDVLAMGVAPGPDVAAILAAAERRWIDEDFPSPERAGAILREEIARVTGQSR